MREVESVETNKEDLSCHSRDDHCHCHGHSHHDHDDESRMVRAYETGIALVLFAIGMGVRAWSGSEAAAIVWKLALIASYLVAGWRVLWGAVKNIARGQVFDEFFLMSIASVGAIAIGELPEAAGVMCFFAVGELLQDKAVERSRTSIRALMDIRPDYASLVRDGEYVRVSPEEIVPGQLIIVRPGERVPLDGVIIEGVTTMDTSALTGESMPRALGDGDQALAGMINRSATVTIKVLKEYSKSSVARILELVEEAQARKAHTERFITTFSRYYTPAVVALAAMIAVLPPLILPGQVFSDWLHRALVLLVISCPCALVISIPLGYFAGIGGASRRGVLIKGANHLEALNSVDAVIFDKTGTLTEGSFRVMETTGENGFTEHEVLRLAAHAGANSNHPVSTSIREAFQGEPGRGEIDASAIAGSRELAGMGVAAEIEGERVVAGNDRLLHHENVAHDVCVTDGTVVNVAKDGVLAGRIHLADEIKPGASEAVERLYRAGVDRIVMLTGDVPAVAERVAGQVGIGEFWADLLPEEKVKAVEAITAESGRRAEQAERGKGRAERCAHGRSGILRERTVGKVAFVGDGINDAPALARADVGIAMGALGSEAAIEAADVVIMDDNPARVADAIEIARRTRRIVMQNIIFSISVKLAVLVLGALGVATMWNAVFADVGVALIAVVNATRAYGNLRDGREFAADGARGSNKCTSWCI